MLEALTTAFILAVTIAFVCVVILPSITYWQGED